MHFGEEAQSPFNITRNPLQRLAPGKLIGLLFGSLVVIVMLFMMFVVLGNLLTGDQ